MSNCINDSGWQELPLGDGKIAYVNHVTLKVEVPCILGANDPQELRDGMLRKGYDVILDALAASLTSTERKELLSTLTIYAEDDEKAAE